MLVASYISLPINILNQIVSYSKQYSVDYWVAAAVAQVCSGGVQINSDGTVVTNGLGGVGVMGVSPQEGSILGLNVLPSYDPATGNLLDDNSSQNIQAGVEYLSQLLQVFSGKYPLALAAYITSPATVQRFNGVPPIPTVQSFVYSVSTLAAQAGSGSVSALYALQNQMQADPTSPATQVGNIIQPGTTGTNYGSASTPEQAAQNLSSLQASSNPRLQVPDASLSATPWFNDRNLITGNPQVRKSVQPVSFMVYLDQKDPSLFLYNPQTNDPITLQLNTSMTTFEITSKHVFSRTPSRTGMHITLWGMQPDLISGSGSTGVFMNQYGLTDWFSTAQINDEIAALVGKAFSSNPDTESEIAQNPEAYRVAAQDAFVEFLKLFQMNGNVWYQSPNYTGSLTGQEQQYPSGWSKKVGATTFQQNSRNNDVMARGYVAMKYRNNIYLGYFKSLSWTQDAENPFQWKFQFAFQVERTYSSLYYPNYQATTPVPVTPLLAQAVTPQQITVTSLGGFAVAGGVTSTKVNVTVGAGPAPPPPQTSTSTLPDQIT